MIGRFLAVIVLIFGPPAQAADVARIVYLDQQDDPYYEPQTSYTGLSLRDHHRPIDGARVAMRDTRILARSLGITFELDEISLAPGVSAAAAVHQAKTNGALAVILDLPEESLSDVVASEGAGGVLFNIRSPEERWRGRDCAPALFSTAPSRAMLSDALAQQLRARNWNRIMLMHGPTDADIAQAAAVRASAAKFGLEIAVDRAFEVTNDPRRRDSSNIALLTGDARYDVIWLVDSEGEFGRYVPYSGQLARPVVGSEGLVAESWHWTLERYGAPQLNQRFRRAANRDMTSEDWAAWAAVKAVIEAVQQTRSVDPASVAAYIGSAEMAIDLYKGVRGNFRSWDGQLRQPILLATHNAVIAIAPIAGFEHARDTLDTLGEDQADSVCHR